MTLADRISAGFQAVAETLLTRGMPAGGSAGQMLTKRSANDYDVQWATGSSSGAAGPVPFTVGVGDWLLGPASSGIQSYGQSEGELDVIIEYLPKGTYDQAAVNCTSAGSAGCMFRPAVYTNVDGRPVKLWSSSPQIDSTSTGVKPFTFDTPLIVPEGGAWVWRGVALQGGASTRAQFTRAVGQSYPDRQAATPSAYTMGSTINTQNYFSRGVGGAPPSTWTDTGRYESAARFAWHRSA